MNNEAMPKRIQMSRQRPWRKDNPDAVVVARPSKWGNPFACRKGSIDKPTVVGLFAKMLESEKELEAFEYPIQDIEELRGKDLACWCALDEPCHADELIRVANQKGKEQ